MTTITLRIQKPRLDLEITGEVGRNRVGVIRRDPIDGLPIQSGTMTLDALERALSPQGLPADFLRDAPFTASGKSHAVGNGVPLPMGRAIARAVKRALYLSLPPEPQP